MPADPPRYDERPAPTEEDKAADEAAHQVSIAVRLEELTERAQEPGNEQN